MKHIPVAALLCAAATPATAQIAPSSDAPIDISSERADFADDVLVWHDSVRIVQENSVLTADRVEAVTNDEGGFDTIVASGDVRYSNGREAITGSRAEFDNSTRVVTMTGDVVVTQGKQTMTAGSVQYWIDTGKVRFLPVDGGRIRGVFYAGGEAP